VSGVFNIQFSEEQAELLLTILAEYESIVKESNLRFRKSHCLDVDPDDADAISGNLLEEHMSEFLRNKHTSALHLCAYIHNCITGIK
jgi:hypothetical protein